MQSSTGYTHMLFAFQQSGGTWQAAVEPEYYGLLLFARATPPGSRLLAVSPNAPAGLHAWATQQRSGGMRVVLINDGRSARAVRLRIPGANGPAALQRLTAPDVTAQAGISFGGQTFGPVTTTGRLSGDQKTEQVTPDGDRYVVAMPAQSAALLSVG